MAGYPDWTRAIQLLGRDVATGEDVILGLDSDGRITVFLVDDTDQWGQVLAVGNAELAARLGSPVAWDRRGNVLRAFDFANGLHGLQKITSGAGAIVALNAEHWQTGGYSLYMIGGNDVDRKAYVRAGFGLATGGRLGGTICWAVEAIPQYLELCVGGSKAETLYTGRIRYDFPNEKLQYQDSDEAWQDIATKTIATSTHVFHHLKLVVDIDAVTYVRAMLDDSQYDLTGTLPSSADPKTGGHCFTDIFLYSNEGENDSIYVDSLIMTVKEP